MAEKLYKAGILTASHMYTMKRLYMDSDSNRTKHLLLSLLVQDVQNESKHLKFKSFLRKMVSLTDRGQCELVILNNNDIQEKYYCN